MPDNAAFHGPESEDAEEADLAAPFDVLADVLAGLGGDPARGRAAARRLLRLRDDPVKVDVPEPLPPNAARHENVASWLREVLNDAEHRAATATGEFEQYVWLGESLGWMPESRPARARVESERSLLALHDGPHECPGFNDPRLPACPVVLQLAGARRFDAEGWRPEWRPRSLP